MKNRDRIDDIFLGFFILIALALITIVLNGVLANIETVSDTVAFVWKDNENKCHIVTKKGKCLIEVSSEEDYPIGTEVEYKVCHGLFWGKDIERKI